MGLYSSKAIAVPAETFMLLNAKVFVPLAVALIVIVNVVPSVIDKIAVFDAIPVPVTDIPIDSNAVLAVVTVAFVIVVVQLKVNDIVKEFVPVAVAALDIVNVVPSGIVEMVEFAGIPVPVTDIPTDNDAVLLVVIVVLVLVVEQLKGKVLADAGA